MQNKTKIGPNSFVIKEKLLTTLTKKTLVLVFL